MESGGQRAVRTIGDDRVVYSMDKSAPPALQVCSGDIVVATCNDCFGGCIRTEQDDPATLDHDKLNPATGPIFVNGAEPGDVLAVSLLRIDVGDQGSAPLYPGEFGFLKDDPIEALTKIAAVVDGMIVYRDDVRIPVRPMMGTVGVAPAGAPISNLYMGDHGGNMDHKDAGVGSTVYLPVFVPGALLAVGDAHAVIGDGEAAAAGLEVPAVVTMQLEVLKGRSLPRPMIETPDEIMTCGWGETMEQATSCAMRDMVDFIEAKLETSRAEAYNLVGMVGDVRPGNAVCVPGAVRYVMPRAIFTNGIAVR
ncbi:MAG: acetamidase/formamidase family protein [Actinobacteria bacterium]|nr:acetamidase/formamidase family protein [Actinomycetota bacterium]